MSGPRDGMNWAPEAEKPTPVVEKGQFAFASAFFEHGHIYGQTNGLVEAGGGASGFYGQFILDCLERTERAMTQAHCFKAAELSLQAQHIADLARARAPDSIP